MFVDFSALKNAVSIEQVVDILGLEMKPSGNQLRSSCPACKTTGGRELVVTPSKGAFYCFKDGKGGDLIALAAHIEGISVKDAASFIYDQLGEGKVLGTVHSTGTSTAKSVPAEPKGFDRAKYQESLSRDHELLKDIPADFIDRADIGVSTKGALKGIVLPLYDKDTGEFLCYAHAEGLQLPKATVIPLKKRG